ncbi:MAG: cytochrome c biogenesis protein [Bacteroidales bacterium]
MINWDSFIYFSILTILLLSIASFNLLRGRNLKYVLVPALSAIAVYILFIIGLWNFLDRPPMRTMGETRLLYSFFLMLIGLITWYRSKYKIILLFSFLLSSVFMMINILKPEIHEKELMPALNSPWFVPHVSVYMIAYACIGCAFILSLIRLCRKNKTHNSELLSHCDKLFYDGIGLLTIGMMMGALWAKDAWGDYWSWDPKEVWAAITWITGIMYIHYRLNHKKESFVADILIIICFLFFQICWYGINYLPTAANSVHTYMN